MPEANLHMGDMFCHCLPVFSIIIKCEVHSSSMGHGVIMTSSRRSSDSSTFFLAGLLSFSGTMLPWQLWVLHVWAVVTNFW